MQSELQIRVKNALNWLYSTQAFGIKLGLKNSEKLLHTLSLLPLSPQTQVIQVAGTNGKGSTSAFIESIARTHGLKTGLFTSPHLVRYNERIQVSGEEITDQELALAIEKIKTTVHSWKAHPTFFEISLALALDHFQKNNCDLIILEVGMGGRLDATSAVPKDIAVITPIGLDHQQHLGDTLSQIASEKAGIMRPHIPCISAPQAQEAKTTLQQHAKTKDCPLEFITTPWTSSPLGLKGNHQQWNAALAIAALKRARISLQEKHTTHGLKTTIWPGRFQKIQEKSDRMTILDCCHNAQSARTLKTLWEQEFGSQKAHLIFGAAQDKNILDVLTEILPFCESVETYEIKNPRAATTKTLTTLIQQLDSKLPSSTLKDLTASKPAPLTLVTGSIFLVGEWLTHTAESSITPSEIIPHTPLRP